jgi:hypothetical protein
VNLRRRSGGVSVGKAGATASEGSFKLIYKDAAAKIPRPPGDAEYRKAQGMPPHPDDKDEIFK